MSVDIDSVKKGYIVIHDDNNRMDATILCAIRDYVGDIIKDKQPIFNYNDREVQDDNKRFQAKLDQRLTIVKSIKEYILSSIRSSYHIGTRRIGKMVLLHSEAGCQQQHWHTDYDPDVLQGLAELPWGVVLAIENGTSLDIIDPDTREPVSIQLLPGSLIFFRGDIVHAGAAYSGPNNRIHAYLDTDIYRQTANKTYLDFDSV